LAKTKTKQVEAVYVLTLDYHLAELPSSQHRAGLAGLVLVVQWLERQPKFKEEIEDGAIYKVTRLDDKGATLELNQAGLAVLFNEIYDASTEEQERPQPLKNKQKEVIPPLREEERQETDAKGN
jgi:CRISPR-associated protein Cmx8